MGAADDEALDAAAFARLIDPLGPFEPNPSVAVAVSGGQDSRALALLAAPWAARRGGTATALVVDHGLSDGSDRAASHTLEWLAARGIACVRLSWEAAKPKAGIQAAAREARYRLLGEWCAENGVLHLVTAHHRDDQAETVLLRLAAGSGLDGLAAMPPVLETSWGRILRPLLRVGRSRLRATLVSLGQGWIEDPANADPAFARARLRRSAGVLQREGLTPARLAATASRVAAARETLERETAALLARCTTVFPAGYALVDRRTLAAAPVDLSRRALERILGCIGGRRYAPRRARLEPLLDGLRGTGVMQSRTLAGCAIRPSGGTILFVREAGTIRETVPAVAGGKTLWDGRFRISFAPAAKGPDALHLRALGASGWRTVRGTFERALPMPDEACRALPAVYDGEGVLEVPHLSWRRETRAIEKPIVASMAFAPSKALAATEFAVV